MFSRHRHHATRKYLPLATLTFLSAPAFAQDAPPLASPTPTPEPTAPADSSAPAGIGEPDVEIVVTPTRTTRTRGETASSVTLISRRQIEEKKSPDFIDILRLAPGLSVSQNGTRGKVASIFLRGSNSNQTLVLIDGVRANSPADGRFDVGTLAPENIERIEVLRGPQSALYGADAIGGVVNVITRRGSGPLTTGGAIEFGSQSTNRQVVTARGDVSGGSLSFTASRIKTGGFFANDDYRNTSGERPLRPRAERIVQPRPDRARRDRRSRHAEPALPFLRPQCPLAPAHSQRNAAVFQCSGAQGKSAPPRPLHAGRDRPQLALRGPDQPWLGLPILHQLALEGPRPRGGRTDDV
jgi:outer membrane receptor protein involved in Fe transport